MGPIKVNLLLVQPVSVLDLVLRLSRLLLSLCRPLGSCQAERENDQDMKETTTEKLRMRYLMLLCSTTYVAPR